MSETEQLPIEDHRRTPPFWFSEDARAAWEKYHRAGRVLFTLDDDELAALHISTHFDGEIKAEKKRRKKVADAAAEEARLLARAQAAARPHPPALTEAVVDAALDEWQAAVKTAKETAGDVDALQQVFLKYGDSAQYDPRVLRFLTELSIEALYGKVNRERVERDTAFAALAARVQGLEDAPATAKAAPAVAYKGIWSGADSYREGDLATHRGGLWLAKQPSLSKRPGIDHDSWLLVVKSGAAE